MRGKEIFYEIKVQGHLDDLWSDWFDGLAVANLDSGEAILSGWLPDQAALHGVLAKVRDLNLTLVSVTRTEPGSDATVPNGSSH
jgi:hypothetical protein